ncbi:hypothetical protein ILUMI_04865 [Ignelater luminosus]|uniref:Uncharacterized protein n=1 Tax=Ignelater luminosus TaxID=2038154 RepID=A0A8K0DD18_IGNLU|nr:hypothetical protein ILUMI_04865 [Ignelater luminosus]
MKRWCPITVAMAANNIFMVNLLDCAIRYGYKLWVGCTRLGYLNWMELYQGATSHIENLYRELGVGSGVVFKQDLAQSRDETKETAIDTIYR